MRLLPQESRFVDTRSYPRVSQPWIGEILLRSILRLAQAAITHFHHEEYMIRAKNPDGREHDSDVYNGCEFERRLHVACARQTYVGGFGTLDMSGAAEHNQLPYQTIFSGRRSPSHAASTDARSCEVDPTTLKWPFQERERKGKEKAGHR